MKAKNAFFLSIGIVLLVASFVVTGVLYFKLKKVSEEKLVTIEPTEQQVEPIIIEQTEPEKNNPKDFTADFKAGGLSVEWLGEAVPVSEKKTDELLAKAFPSYLQIKQKVVDINNDCKKKFKGDETQCLIQDPNIYLYEVGKIKNLDNAALYYIYMPQLFQRGMGGLMLNVVLGFFDTKTNAFIAIFDPQILFNSVQTLSESAYGFTRAELENTMDDEQTKQLALEYPDLNIFSGYIVYQFDELLNAPVVINVPNTKSKLINTTNFDYYSIGKYGNAGIEEYAKGEVVTSQFKELPVEFKTDSGLELHQDGQCYYTIKPNGTIVSYNLIPGFMSWEREASKEYYGEWLNADITWNSGAKNTDVYMLSGDYASPGCGGPSLTDCTNVVNDKKWFDAAKLIPTGTGNNGEKIFETKNAENNEFYKESFKRYRPEEAVSETAKSFSEFLADHAIIFWQDHVNNWHVYLKTSYQRPAECGKPVIYLYPEKDTDVKVEVKPNGGFTKTEPMYNNGWFVRATPESELFNYTDKTNYPYLFWEGKAYDYVTPNYGFVMSKADVGTKMTQILAKLGLNERETEDFLEFWQPKLKVKPYVFVTFLPQREFDKLAPLTVNPKPDTVIRVFMDYTPLDAPVKVAPMQIRTPERVGFTVVEWGGRLR